MEWSYGLGTGGTVSMQVGVHATISIFTKAGVM